MKHILNNITQDEKNRILEQHRGGIKVMSDSFRRLVNGKLGNSKPLVMEQTEPLTSAGFNKVTEINLPDGDYIGNPPSYETLAQSEQKKVSSNLSQGIQNVSPQMITSPPFKGTYSSSTFGGNFNGVDYEWVANGVEGMSGIRSISYGVVLTENNSYLIQKGITDADPSGTWVGFADDNGQINFACYKTTGGTIKCTNNSEI